MKISQLKLIALFLLINWIGNAQKYSNTDQTVVTKSWNGNSFSSTKSFTENISEVLDFSMLKRVLENKEILKAIEDEEMVTIFVISNKGFEKYQETKDSIFSSSNVEMLNAIIKFHIIPGRVDSHSINKAIERKGGTIYFATLQGEKIGIKEENGQLLLVDSKENTSIVSATDFYHKNGFFHIVDGIIFPTN